MEVRLLTQDPSLCLELRLVVAVTGVAMALDAACFKFWMLISSFSVKGYAQINDHGYGKLKMFVEF